MFTGVGTDYGKGVNSGRCVQPGSRFRLVSATARIDTIPLLIYCGSNGFLLTLHNYWHCLRERDQVERFPVAAADDHTYQQ